MTQKPFIAKQEGLWLEWFVRRSSLEVDVYVENPDHTRGQLVSQLEYPKVSGIGFSDWTPEAISKAKLVELLRELKRLKDELTEEQYWLLTLIVHCLKLWPEFEPSHFRVTGTRCYSRGFDGERNLLRDTDKRVSWRVRKG